MNDKFFLVPAKGVQVRDPQTREPLPVEGDWKPTSAYWLRRKEDGDVAESSPAVKPAAKSAK